MKRVAHVAVLSGGTLLCVLLMLGQPNHLLAQDSTGQDILDLAQVEIQVTAAGLPLAGATVSLDLDNDGVWNPDAGEPQDQTDAAGMVLFSGIVPVEDPPTDHQDDPVAWRPARLLTGNLRGTVGAATVRVDFVVPPGSDRASLSVFDVRGRRLARTRGPGDLSLDLPGSLPAGVYFVQLSAAGHAPVTHRITSVGTRARTVTAHRVTAAEAAAAGWAQPPEISREKDAAEEPHHIHVMVEHAAHDPVVQPEILVAGANAFTVEMLSEPDAAVVVLDASAPTAQEVAVRDLLVGCGRYPVYVDAADANPADLAPLGLVAAAENGAVDTDLIDDLLAGGQRLWLWHEAGMVLGGTWNDNGFARHRSLVIAPGDHLLASYQSSLGMLVQGDDRAAWIDADPPAGWAVIGHNAQDATDRTALIREHASGGKAMVLTYRPDQLTGTGRGVSHLIYRWLEDEPVHTGIVVPDGHAALVTSGDQAGPDAPLTAAENGQLDLLLGWGYQVTVVPFARLPRSDLSGAALVVGVEYPGLDRDTIASLLDAGLPVLLPHRGGGALGGDWTAGGHENHRTLMVEADAIFLDGYQTTIGALLQTDEDAHAIQASYPAHWTPVAHNRADTAQKTVLHREVPGGGRGLVFAFRPDQFTPAARNLLDMAHHWLTGAAVPPGITVPAGHAALVIRGDADGVVPDLTATESALRNRLLDWGHEVTTIRSGRLAQSDLSGAALLAAAAYPTLDRHTVDDALAAGIPVYLTHRAGAVIGGVWDTHTTAGGREDLLIEADAGFLDGYSSNLAMQYVESIADALWLEDALPGGWTAPGANGLPGQPATVLCREHASGARAVVDSYRPDLLTGVARNLADLAHRWLTGTPAHPGVTVPAGEVAFVTSGHEDGSIADLTAAEAALHGLLLDWGCEVTFLRAARVPDSDLSAASLVTAAEFPSLDRYTVDALIAAGQPVLLPHRAGAVVGGVWGNHSTTGGTRRLHVTADACFLDGYASDLTLAVQDQEEGHYIDGSYPPGWSCAGANADDDAHQTVLHRETPGGGKGLIFTYDPAELSGPGRNLMDLAYGWLSGSPPHAGVTVPAGHVAFVITGHADGGTPELTAAETAHHGNLLDAGHQVTFLRLGRLAASDLSAAALVTGVEYPSLDAGTAEQLLADGGRVLLIHTAGAVLGGDWSWRTNDPDYWDLVVESSTDYLASYGVGAELTVQSDELAHRVTADYPTGWTVLGRNSQSAESRTAFSRTVGTGRGALYTYNPGWFTTAGEGVFAEILGWLTE